ncbi:MAG: alpha/beta fold hydrolase [Akkermansiaceae bacterium]|nr:alpha/beta fold hydrolase [Akkermansiaceae bacterium]MCP5544274.1 alpha/beta fold hydrolase [Akkermansiaceae bacterium]MCP5547002.1 alpha/beta fold hydrolase [Akkermansiaceae bacterium]
MIRSSKLADETREAGPVECWCLHGAVGMAADWREISKLLAAAKTSCRAIDLWRFLEPTGITMTDFGRALNAEADQPGFRGTGRVLVGYSMGGRLALQALLAERAPWSAAVIVSAHPGLSDEPERRQRAAADKDWAAKAMLGDWKSFLSEWGNQPVLGGDLPRDPATLAAMVSRRREIARSFVDWSLGAQEPLWERLEQIRIPLLWIAGEADSKFLELARLAVERIPKARLAIAPGAGHRVPWDAPGWFSNEVASFCRTGGENHPNP